MAWIDNKKASDMIPQSWIIDCLKMYQISYKVLKFIKERKKTGEWNWKQGEKRLAVVKVQRGISMEMRYDLFYL